MICKKHNIEKKCFPCGKYICSICNAGKAKKWRKANPEKAARIKKRYRDKNKDKLRQYISKWKKNNREKARCMKSKSAHTSMVNITDSYCAKRLSIDYKIKRETIYQHPELIQSYRQQIKLKRLLKTKKHENTKAN